MRLKTICLLCVAVFQNCLAASSIPQNTRITQTSYFNHVAVSDAQSVTKSGAVMFKVLFNEKKTPDKLSTKNYATSDEQDPTAGIGKSIWEITADLPITEIMCIVNYADPCTESNNKVYDGSCFKPCIAYGPRLLAFDEKTNKAYLYASSVSIGTDGGPYFIFAADLTKKKIDYLFTDHGPLDASLSPKGDYLVIYSRAAITVYQAKTNEKFEISATNASTPYETRLHYIGDIKWLNENQFSYQDGIRHSKFQDSFDNMQEIVYDIPHKKALSTRTMAKTEYDSTPYVES